MCVCARVHAPPTPPSSLACGDWSHPGRYPPRAWNSTFVYPFLHPRHGQCQVDALAATSSAVLPRPGPGASHPHGQGQDPDADADARGLYRGAARDLAAARVEVVLEPGELLYLPPNWFHETEALTEAISVNVWTEPDEAVAMEAAFAAAAEAMQRVSHTAAGLALLIQAIVSACGGGTPAPSAFVAELVDVRYRYRRGPAFAPKPGFGAGAVDTYGGAAVCGEGSAGLTARISPDRVAGWDASFRAGLRSGVEATCAHVRTVPPDTRPIWLGNLVEYIAAHVGGVVQAAAYLSHIAPCL